MIIYADTNLIEKVSLCRTSHQTEVRPSTCNSNHCIRMEKSAKRYYITSSAHISTYYIRNQYTLVGVLFTEVKI